MERKMMIPRNVIKGLTNNPLRYDKIEILNQSKMIANDRFKELERGEYKGNRFSGTNVKIRPRYDDSIAAFYLGDLAKDPERLNKLVRDCAFTYEDGRRKGELIEEVNPKNRRDPFMLNSRLYIRAEEGFYIFNPDKAIDIIMLEVLKNDNRVAFTEDTDTMTKETQFFIVPVDYETNKKIKEISKQKDIFNAYYNLSSYDKRKIAIILGESVDIDTDDEYVDSILFERIMNPTKVANGVTTADEVFELAKLPPDVLKTKEILALSYKHRVFDKEGNIFYLKGNAIGSSLDEIEEYFNEYENKELFGFLKKQLKKKINIVYEPDDIDETKSVKESGKAKEKRRVSKSKHSLTELDDILEEE